MKDNITFKNILWFRGVITAFNKLRKFVQFMQKYASECHKLKVNIHYDS